MIDIIPLLATAALLALPQISSTDPPPTTSPCANPEDYHCTIGITNVNIRKGDPYAEEYKKGCIPAAWKCDQKLDCADSSDELDCGTQCMSATDFQCVDGMSWYAAHDDDEDVEARKGCIDESLRCNYDQDCADWSDEMNCPLPPATPTTDACSDIDYPEDDAEGLKGCIDAESRCDAYYDCADRSDEENCPVDRPNGQVQNSGQCLDDGDFKCRSGIVFDWAYLYIYHEERQKGCVPFGLKCNDIPFCMDWSDEANCTRKEKQTAPQAPTRSLGKCTTESDFQCTLGMTLEDTEESADDYEERRKGCLPISKKCDGSQDCADNSDEADCLTRLSAPCADATNFQCEKLYENQDDDDACIPGRWECDGGTPDCRDSSDEKYCPQYVTQQRPDNSPACINKRNFQCKTGFTTVHIRDGDDFAEEYERGCLPRSFRCDGHRDCEDYSDEKDCPICDSTCDCDCMRLMDKLFE